MGKIIEHMKPMLKATGTLLSRMIGLTVFCAGAVESIMWLMILGFVLTDITPCAIKAVWIDVWRVRD